jgi:asparagine synthetase B (glutamine-hydrolysing)
LGDARSSARWRFAVIIVDLQTELALRARPHWLVVLNTICRPDDLCGHSSGSTFCVELGAADLEQGNVCGFLVGRLKGEDLLSRHFRVLPVASFIAAQLFQNVVSGTQKHCRRRFTSDHDYVEAFKERLDEAVRASLRSCGPPCAMITGGLDSSSIAVVAADMLAASGNRLNTFTAVPEAGSHEELPGLFR